MTEPEFITIVEGPTPAFRPSGELWLQSVYEGPDDVMVAGCELRTLNGRSIMERCLQAWQERRPVRLDFPDRMGLRQEVDVVGMRLREVAAGLVLVLWVRLPIVLVDETAEEADEGEDDGLSYS